jgi:hypothetical protein
MEYVQEKYGTAYLAAAFAYQRGVTVEYVVTSPLFIERGWTLDAEQVAELQEYIANGWPVR